MGEVGLVRARELRDDPLGERLPQLHAPLVERVDAPDRPLREDAVLVEGDERAERERGELLGEEDVRRTVDPGVAARATAWVMAVFPGLPYVIPLYAIFAVPRQIGSKCLTV